MPGPFGYLRRQAIVRGLVGGSRGWLLLGTVAWGFHLFRRFASTRRLRTVLSEELQPGERLVIAHLSDETK